MINEITLWGVSISPFVRKVKMALAEKGLTYKQEEILPGSLAGLLGQEVSDVFKRISPLQKIPAIEIGEYYLSESAIICAYLDKVFHQGTSLYPENPQLYAKVRWFENYADSILTEVSYKKIFLESVIKPTLFKLTPNEKAINQVKTEELPPFLNFLEHSLQENKWIAGEEFSVADLALTTQFISLQQAGYQVDSNRWPKIYDYLQEMRKRPSLSEFYI